MADQMRSSPAPMEDIQVLNLGTGWAARVSSMMLADQGADVIEIVKPGRTEGPIDVFLDRGKCLLELDLKDSSAAARARDIAMTADVIVLPVRSLAQIRGERTADNDDALSNWMNVIAYPNFCS